MNGGRTRVKGPLSESMSSSGAHMRAEKYCFLLGALWPHLNSLWLRSFPERESGRNGSRVAAHGRGRVDEKTRGSREHHSPPSHSVASVPAIEALANGTNLGDGALPSVSTASPFPA